MSFRPARRIIVAVTALSILAVIGFGRFGSSSSFAEQAAMLLSNPVAPTGLGLMAAHQLGGQALAQQLIETTQSLGALDQGPESRRRGSLQGLRW